MDRLIVGLGAVIDFIVDIWTAVGRRLTAAGVSRSVLVLGLIGTVALVAFVGEGIRIATGMANHRANITASKTNPTQAPAFATPIAAESTSPTPSPSASPSPSPSSSPVKQVPAPAPAAGGAAYGTRGLFRFSSTDWTTMHAAGFNASTDGGVQDSGAAQAASGITGMVWVGAYDNSSCKQTMTDSAIAGLVQTNVAAGHPGLRYQIGDEPTANGCAAAPVYAHITQVVHSADPRALTWVADDQFQDGNPRQPGIPMMGSVDILAFDVYPCQSGPCDLSAIDSAVAQIHAAGLKYWEFIMQDFNSGPWRWPTPAELLQQFDHWKNQGAIGYWFFAWDYQGQSVTSQPGNIDMLRQINS